MDDTDPANMMDSDSSGASPTNNADRPAFILGHHNSTHEEPLTEPEYFNIQKLGFDFATTRITNAHFRRRVVEIVREHLQKLASSGCSSTTTATHALTDPIVPPLTPDDTSLLPGNVVRTFAAYVSPWIDLCSSHPVIANISRQVLNLEAAYANFCGVRTIVIPGPRLASCGGEVGKAMAQYARAIKEVVAVAARMNYVVIHMPMYHEPGLDESVKPLSVTMLLNEDHPDASDQEEIDLFASWEEWHLIRSFCNYSPRLWVSLRLPRMMPEMELQDRWFSEPLLYISISASIFQTNNTGYPCLSQHHRNMIFRYMRLKHPPWLLICDAATSSSEMSFAHEFPTIDEAHLAVLADRKESRKSHTAKSYISYLKWVETRQDPLIGLDMSIIRDFQDWLQSPLQPLSDNLDSSTYEVFEGDPVKYAQYEAAIGRALTEWRSLGKPTSSSTPGRVVIAVAGSGRGPLVSRALQASLSSGVPVEVWAVEKNPNAYVYLLHQNATQWNGQVRVVKTDMRTWKGPLVAGTETDNPVYGKVDILVSELLGSFGDNELSPECLDGIQHVIAKPHGISIPSSYTAFLSPISTPKIYSELLTARLPVDPNAFDTPWVTRLYAMDLVAQRNVPGHPRFQLAWEFSHPVPESTIDAMKDRSTGGVVGGGGGSMEGAAGVNDHNSRFCHMTFVCRNKGVIHGLAGFFESVLFEQRSGEKVELSILPNMIDAKSKDMVSWFPIFFPMRNPITYPADTELEVAMWRQTDDKKVWYEWLVDAYTWVGPKQRIKVGSSGLCSSRKVGCIM